jgi:hypothetical protein
MDEIEIVGESRWGRIEVKGRGRRAIDRAVLIVALLAVIAIAVAVVAVVTG